MRRLDGRILAAAAVVAIAGAYWVGAYRERQAAAQAEADRRPWDLQRRIHDLEADLDCGTLRGAAQRAALVTRALDGGAVMAVIGYDMVTQQVSVTVVDRGQRVAFDRRYLACP
jgi:hypothetical protein